MLPLSQTYEAVKMCVGGCVCVPLEATTVENCHVFRQADAGVVGYMCVYTSVTFLWRFD